MSKLVLHRWMVASVFLGTLVGAAAGCGKEQIHKYRVARLEPLKPVAATSAAANGTSSAPSTAKEATRMVAAIVERPEATWVFKIVGSPADVGATESSWRGFLAQVQFDENNLPRWTLPPDWVERPGDNFRFASLSIPGAASALEMAVSRLPPGQDLLMNVNRWRGQLELDPMQADGLVSSLGKIAVGKTEALLFDATGRAAATPSMPGAAVRPPTDSGPGRVPTELAAAGDVELPFEYTAPEQWESGATTSFTLRRFLKRDGDRSAQLAVTRLPNGGQSWADNVGVWCGELGIAALDRAEVDRQTQKTVIDGREANSIALESADPQGKASQIVCWTDSAESWFFKLTGDKSMVAESRPAFEQFLRSIRFKSKPTGG